MTNVLLAIIAAELFYVIMTGPHPTGRYRLRRWWNTHKPWRSAP